MRRACCALAALALVATDAAAPLPGKSTLFTGHFGSPSQRDAGLADAAALAGAAGAPTAARLRVNYLASPISVDTPAPKFSWALSSPARGAVQSAYQIVVFAAASGATVWDSGKVPSAQTLNVKYGGGALASDTDYLFNVTWWDSGDVPSAPATSRFSTALFDDAAWKGAAYVSSGAAGDGSLNTYRTTFTVGGAGAVVRARLYVLALGYVKTTLNGAPTDDHELGTFTTFEQRVLYDTVDVTGLVRVGCNALGVAVGHGWWAQPSVKSGPRGFRALLSVTTTDGGTSYFASAVGGGGALVFSATSGPVLEDDIYQGETYDGRVAAALAGFATCAYAPAPGTTWSPATAPAVTPATLGSVVSAHNVWIRTDREYTATAITQPGPGQFVFDFFQNMAAQVTLRVPDCDAGTVITMRHAEILYTNGSVHNHYAPDAKMTGTYICAGTGAEEVYSTQFTYYGSRYVQLEGFPGVPGENALTSRFVHSDFLQAGEFSSSDARLNAIQHATRYASWSNWMDIPTDCPQRERRGWLGDAQLSFETVISNIDGGAVYTKWISDLVDTQVYDNRTSVFNAAMAMPDCVPFYGHGHVESDPGWGIAAWNVADWFGSYYADEEFERTYYTNTLVPYMEHWVSLAQAKNPPLFPVAWWGDWVSLRRVGPWGDRASQSSCRRASTHGRVAYARESRRKTLTRAPSRSPPPPRPSSRALAGRVLPRALRPPHRRLRRLLLCGRAAEDAVVCDAAQHPGRRRALHYSPQRRAGAVPRDVLHAGQQLLRRRHVRVAVLWADARAAARGVARGEGGLRPRDDVDSREWYKRQVPWAFRWRHHRAQERAAADGPLRRQGARALDADDDGRPQLWPLD